MSKRSAEKSPPNTSDAGSDSATLDGQYRNIGISAVAAALPYRGDAKNPAYAAPGRDGHRASRKRSVLSV